MRMKAFLALGTVCALAFAGLAPANSQGIIVPGLPDAPVSAPAGAVEYPLYGTANPGDPADIVVTKMPTGETVLRNITYPTLTPVLPEPGKANGAAVIVAPGGGFMMLSIQNEGWRVAQALADQGIAAFVLKYRLRQTPLDQTLFMRELGKLLSGVPREDIPEGGIDYAPATQDTQAALEMVRTNAANWGIDSDRVGIIGFSAGAMAAMQTVVQADGDQNGPDFMGYIYGPMQAIDVPVDAPPMFAAIAMDDQLFNTGEFPVVTAWHKAGRPVELHAYQSGGHGFGPGRAGTTNAMLLDQFVAWLDMQGFMKDEKNQ